MDAQISKDPYFSQKRASSILFGVLLVHIGIIAIPLIYSSLTDYFDPPVIVMKVGLADLPLGDSPDAGAPADAPADSAVSEPDPVSVDDIPDPHQVADLPPDIPPPPPKVENPPPKPKTDTKKPVEEPPPKPKTDTKTNVKPPKTEQKKDPPKTQTKQDPPKSNLLKPEDIIKPKNTKTQAQIEAERRAREAAEARAKADARARQDLIADIRAAVGEQGRFGTTNSGQQGILATKEMRDYYEQLNAFIRPKWNAVSPASTELSGKIANWPTIALTIAKDGRITKVVIVRKSGNKAIDAAVEALIADLKAVPVPPQAAVINVTLDIR